MSLIRCSRTAERMKRAAHPSYEVFPHMLPGFRGSPDRCIIQVYNADIQRMARRAYRGILPEWMVTTLSRGGIELNRGIHGEVPTIDKKAAVGRIERCGAEVTAIHDERSLKGEGKVLFPKLAHVHFKGALGTKPCLVRRLLEKP